jgi:hypothetical protein
MGRTPMSQNSRILFVALAAATTLGAAQIAAGQSASTVNASTVSLADRFQAVSEPAGAAGINRTAKSDRAANVPRSTEQARTILLNVGSLADTSVLVRIPVQKEAKNLPPLAPAARSGSDRAKKIVACEPVVSVLTEVAKLLQPGRCVT